MDLDSQKAFKLTLTQLQAFLPLPPPKVTSSLPLSVIQFLASPSFNNLSLKDQIRIQSSYSIAYRSYFKTEAVVEHIHSITDHRFSDKSIIQAVTNAAGKQGLIDWYLFSRIVAKRRKQPSKIAQAQAIEMIQVSYRAYSKKKLERAAYEAVMGLKKSLEDRLLLEFQKEVKGQVFEHIQRNRVRSEEIFQQIRVKQLSFLQFEKLINLKLECGLEIKKLQYLFMAFEKRERFLFSLFKSEMLPSEQKVSDVVLGNFLTIQDLFSLIRTFMNQAFYSWQDLVDKYKEYQSSGDQINLQKFYLFLSSKCEAKISWIQASLLKDSLGVVENLKYLFLKSDPTKILAQTSQLMAKKARRLALKKENPVFYEFRTIILLLIANCKAKKLNRAQLGSFVRKYNSQLKHDAFYAVWRVYGDLVNIQRMRQEVGLNSLPCHLFLTLGFDKYEALHEELLEAFPNETEVPYSKVEQKINLSTNFLLESLQLRPLALKDSDTIDYRTAITQIIPLSLQTTIRSYIFRKVSQKFIVLWRSIRAKKKRNEAIHKALVQKIIGLEDKVPTEDNNSKKQLKIGKKNTSKVPRASASPLLVLKRQKTENQSQAHSITKDILKQVIQSVGSQQKHLIEEGFVRKRQIVLSCFEQYSFRTSLTRVNFHWMLGALACSREFLILDGGQTHRLNLKLPYRPGISPIDFVVWNNQLAVLTSLSSLELYPLGQSQVYPERTLQLSKYIINQKDIDTIVQQRLHRQMPWLLKPSGSKIIVNILHSQELIFVDQDPTIPPFPVKLSFREHFFPQYARNIICYFLKQSPEERLQFIQKSLQRQMSLEQIKEVLPGFTAFQWLQWLDWLQSLGPLNNSVLKTQLKVKKPRALPAEVTSLLQLLRQYMLQKNLSVRELLLEMGCHDEGISAKQLKKYLGKIVGYEAISPATEGWLQSLSSGKKISYQQIVSLVSQKWAYSPVEKPSLIPKSFLLVPNLPILVYTLDGLGQIYVRDVKQGNLIAILLAHSATPIFHLIEEQLVLFSAEPSEEKGKDQFLLLWRLQQDILGKYQERPPWRIKPFLKISIGHQAPITSISYSARSNLLITASLDGSVKLWEINSSPFRLTEVKRIYAQNASFIQAEIHTVAVRQGDVPIEKLITVKIGQQISAQNLFPYESIVEVCFLEPMSAKVPERLGSLPCPVRLIEQLAAEGKRKSIKKKALLGNWQREQIEKIDRGLLALKSLDANFFGALKAAFIFQSQKQLRCLVGFIEGKKYCEMVVTKVLQQYGLELLEDMNIEGLESPPALPVAEFKSAAQDQIYLEQDSVREIFGELDGLLTQSQFISEEKLLKIVKSHFYADLEAKFLNIIKNLPDNSFNNETKKNDQRSYRIANIKKILKEHPTKGGQARMASAFRLLHRRLRNTRSDFWEFFAPSLAQLDRSKRIRTQEFTQKAKSLGLNKQQIDPIISYLSRNGTISLFEFLHFAKNALQENNQSELPNYSSIILGQSIILEPQTIQKESDPELGEKSLHFEVREALQKKSSKVGSQSSSLRGSQVGKKEEGSQTQLKHSTSQGSFSREIKDELERKAKMVVRKLCELLRNEGKSLWEVVGAASHNFISQSLVSRTQFFSIFDYLRTPLRLADKLDLLQFLQREGGGSCDLNALFDLVEAPSKRKVEGDKYLLLHLVDCLQTHFSCILEEALDLTFFVGEPELEAEAFLTHLSHEPFNCSRLALNEWQLLLKEEKLTRFGANELYLLLEGLVIKHRLNIKFSRLGLIQEIVIQLDQKGQTLYQVFPTTKNFTFTYFKEHVSKLSSQLNLEQDFRSLAYSLGLGKKGLEAQLPYDQAIKQIESRIGKVREEEGNEIQAGRRLVKGLQIRRITPFEFFVSMDRNKAFFLTQEQFEVGLVELGISYDLWPDIPKKHQKRLPYNSFIQYLVSKNLLKYKSADSQLDQAMERFLKRFLRNEDLQSVFRRLANNQNQVSFSTFHQALRRVSIEKEEAKLIFGVLVNQKVVRGKRWGNDDAINDPSNQQRTFSFKQFAQTILSYRSDNLMKGPAFRFADYFKRRSISLLFEFKKWLDGNKKIKQVAEAIKKGTQVLSKEIFLLFLNQLHSGLNDNQLKDLVSRWREEVDFHTFTIYLQDVYRRGTSRVQKDQVDSYLKEIAKRIQELKVGLPRLLKDFSDDKGRVGFPHLSSLNDWLGTGLTKVQLRKILSVLDSDKQGQIRGNTLAEALETAQQTLEKDEQDCRFDYIIQKLMNNQTKFVLKNSKLAFTLQRAVIIFETLLTQDQTELLLAQALKESKKDFLTQREMQEYVDRKVAEMRRQRNKKDKEISMRLLKCLQQTGIEIDQAYSYLARHNPKEALIRHEFLLLYQSIEPKSDLVQINSLFQFLQDRDTGAISRVKWQQKLSMIRMQIQEQVTGSQEDLKLFYKVKVYLADVYLLFVRKAFKASQIYHYFDRHSTGLISADDLLNSLDQLGCPPSSELAPKLINYLDRQRNSRISVTLFLQQLQNCLGSRIRQVISTRTSIIFRQKSKVFAQQAGKFISDLAHREEITLRGENYLSTISEASFISLLKEFGCSLAQDQAQDVRRNFQSETEGQLLLYPVYHAFTSLFQGPQTQPSHNQLYRRLMKTLISTGCTLADLKQASTSSQLLAFLQQLGCFSLIQARTVVQNSLFTGSQAVDFQSLKLRLRNAHLNRDEGALDQSLLVSSLKLSMTSSKEATRNQLWHILPFETLKEIVGGNRGKIDLQAFESLLWECGVWVTKGTAKSYFNALAKGQHLDLNQLITLCQANLNKDNQDEGQMMQSRIQVQKHQERQEEDDPVALLIQSGAARIAEHIIKSLNFKGVSLQQQLNKYFTIANNYGFVTHQSFLQFLHETGLANDQLREPTMASIEADSPPKQSHGLVLYKDIEQFLHNYSLLAYKRPYLKTQLISVLYLQQSLREFQKICSLQLQIPTKILYIHSEQLAAWIIQLQQINLSLLMEKWLQERGIIEYHLSYIYRFLFQSYPNKRHLLNTLLKNIPYHVSNYQQFSLWISSFKIEPVSKINNSEPQKESNEKALNSYLFRFLKRNPIKGYQKEVGIFLSVQKRTPSSNLTRIALQLFYIHIQLHSHLILLVPSLIAPPKQLQPPVLEIQAPDFEYQIKAVNSLVVEEEKKIDESGLILANNKWLGLSIDRKYEFQSMAAIAHLLHRDTLFLRSRSLYLWEPPQQLLPSSALNYRWTLIPIIARLILQQLAQVHSHGYCLPHLRWNQLSKRHFIDVPLYPCPINKKGDLKLIVGEASLNFADPYCPPQFYRSQPLSYKCDSWIFGCILYQFIYGHPPNSFLGQLKKHIEKRSIQVALSDLLEMEELPQEFQYIFYDSDKITKAIDIEHHLSRLNSSRQDLTHYVKRQQSFSGMLLSLQILYGEDLPYFKQQMSLMTQLNDTIWQCLSLNPRQRPSVEQLLSMPLFQVEASRKQIDEYLNSLQRHCSSQRFYERSMQPLLSAFEKRQKRQILQKVASDCLKEIISQRKTLVNLEKISDALVIPRQYPWPERSSQGTFSANLLDYRQSISQTANLPIITLMFNSGILDLVVLLSLTDSALAALTIQVLQVLKNTLKDYCPSAAFVPRFLDYLLKLIYLRSKGFIQEDWQGQFKDNPALCKQVNLLVKQIQRGVYWRKQAFNGEVQQKSLAIIRELVLANGQGNSEYLPVAHYLDQHHNLKHLFRVVYNQVALQSQPLAAIEYFIDSLSQQSEVMLQKLCRVEVDLLPFLEKDNQCRRLALLYFRELLTIADQPQIYHFPLLYLYLAHILRNPGENTNHKSIVLDIICSCLQKPSLRKPLAESSAGLIQQAVRLMIEPTKGSQPHKEFAELREKLKLIARSLVTDQALFQEITAGKSSWQGVFIQLLENQEKPQLPIQSKIQK